MRFPKWRFMTWLILAFSGFMLWWAIAGTMSAAKNANCNGDEACQTGTAVGGAIGVGFIFVLWAIGFVILGIIWLMTRSRQRACPVCGNGVKNGHIMCRSCGHDFRSPERIASDRASLTASERVLTGDDTVDFREQLRQAEAAKRSKP